MGAPGVVVPATRLRPGLAMASRRTGDGNCGGFWLRSPCPPSRLALPGRPPPARRGESTPASGICMTWGRILVIARSGSDETIQILARAALDCFAEFIIGPATSGRTRWLAMTRAVPSSRHVMSESCLPPRHSKNSLPRGSRAPRGASNQCRPARSALPPINAFRARRAPQTSVRNLRNSSASGARSPSGALLRLSPGL
jgi:hypothetical protein